MLTYGSILPSPRDISVANEDDSWEVRAFEEDRSSAMGTTWPPPFYSCTFCRREFRSAQALGGHMNVHRRDRARMQLLHNKPPFHAPPSPGTAGVSFMGSMGSSRTISTVGTINFAEPSCTNVDSFLLEKVGKEVEELDLELRLGW